MGMPLLLLDGRSAPYLSQHGITPTRPLISQLGANMIILRQSRRVWHNLPIVQVIGTTGLLGAMYTQSSSGIDLALYR